MSIGQIVKKFFINGTIEAKTGLHIGGTNIGMSIGSVDTTVVRNPINNQPYIPGSSLKGKMRSLTEKLEGKFGGSDNNNNIQKGPFVDDLNHYICQIYGTMPEKIKNENSKVPTLRLIVRDCPLTSESARMLEESEYTDMPFSEVKAETVIDRITSAAVPRQIERVPAGAKFDMQLILNIYEGDDEKALLKHVLKGLILVQNDYLGGKGTRGSGEVKIKVESIKYKTKEDYEKLSGPKKLEGFDIPVELK